MSTATSDRSERILRAALALFGDQGVQGTSLKAIAARAEVSQGLVVHHFGSKDGLRAACDEKVIGLVREQQELIRRDRQMDPLAAMRQLEQSRPVLGYLARALTEGGESVDRLVDGMVADSLDYLQAGEDAGMIKPSITPRERAVVLVIWSLGALVLHEHLHRLLGVDFLAADPAPQDLAPYLRPVLELYTQGLADPRAFERMGEMFGTSSPPGTEAGSDGGPQHDADGGCR